MSGNSIMQTHTYVWLFAIVALISTAFHPTFSGTSESEPSFRVHYLLFCRGGMGRSYSCFHKSPYCSHGYSAGQVNITVDHVNGHFRTHNFIIGIIVVYVMGTLLYVVTVSSFYWLDTLSYLSSQRSGHYHLCRPLLTSSNASFGFNVTSRLSCSKRISCAALRTPSRDAKLI